MRKLTLSLIAVVVVAVIGWGWGISQYYAYFLEENAEQYPEDFEAYKMLGKTLMFALAKAEDPQHSIYQWQQSSTLQASLVALDDLPLPPSLMRAFHNGEVIALEIVDEVSLYFYLPRHSSALALTLPPVNAHKHKVPVNLWLTLLFYGGIVIVILLWLYPLVGRLNVLRKTAIAFGEGALETRLAPVKISYIADIEREFNRMADRIQALVEDNKLLSRAVSHDLKTPLARLRFGFETLSETQSPEQRARYQQRIEQDLEEMESLVETLLQFARLDEANIALTYVPVDLVEIVQKCARNPPPGSCVPTIQVEGPCSIQGDKKYLQMLVKNLYENALNYCDNTVQIKLLGTAQKVVLSVEDDGVGIPEEERALVVKPFFRGSHLARKKGHGMGLAIVNKIVDWHKGELSITASESLHGAKISAGFPR